MEEPTTEDLAYGARPYLDKDPTPAPRDLTKLVYPSPVSPRSGVDEEDPATPEDRL